MAGYVLQEQCESRREKERETTCTDLARCEKQYTNIEAKIDRMFWFMLAEMVTIVIGFGMLVATRVLGG